LSGVLEVELAGVFGVVVASGDCTCGVTGSVDVVVLRVGAGTGSTVVTALSSEVIGIVSSWAGAVVSCADAGAASCVVLVVLCVCDGVVVALVVLDVLCANNSDVPSTIRDAHAIANSFFDTIRFSFEPLRNQMVRSRPYLI
jgi:hypothetical protein